MRVVEEIKRVDWMSEFDRVSLLLRSILEPMEYRIRPESIRSDFERAGEIEKREYIRKCDFYLKLVGNQPVLSRTIVEDHQFIWSAIRSWNCSPPIELFSKMGKYGLVEIYDLAGKQVFSSFNFLRLTSYSLDQLYFYSWDQLFARDDVFLQKILQAFGQAISGDISGPFDPEIPRHEVWECKEGHNVRAIVKMDMFSPIFGVQGLPQYMIAASDIQLIN